jgi:hypothetical protein
MQLQEIIADLNDLLNATLDEEQAQREADAAEWLAEESPFQVVGELEVDITLDGDVRMLPKEDNG